MADAIFYLQFMGKPKPKLQLLVLQPELHLSDLELGSFVNMQDMNTVMNSGEPARIFHLHQAKADDKLMSLKV